MKEKEEIDQKNEIIHYYFDDKVNKIKDAFNVSIKDLRYEKKAKEAKEAKEAKDELYTLINKENEIIFCKNDLFNKIKPENDNINMEYFKKEESDDCYYINKEKMKERKLKNLLEIDKNNEDIGIDNQNEEKMDKLYKEITMKHPRKIVNGQFKKYSFFSWTGFFCSKKGQLCYKDEFISLGFGISSYFKTLKLLILFFFIISCINLIGIVHYSKYKSEKSFLLRTTLENTKTSNYSKMFVSFNDLIGNDTIELSMNCSNKSIGKFIFGIKIGNETIDEQYLSEEPELTLPDNTTVKEYIQYNDLNKFSEKMSECFDINECQKEVNVNRTNLDILLSQNDILPLLKKVNHQSKLLGRQVTLSEFVQQKNVSK
jgi:hypothetical protein